MRLQSSLRLSSWLIALLLVSCSGSGGSQSVATTTTNNSPTVTGPAFTSIVLKIRPAQFSKGYVCPPFLEFGAPSGNVDFLCRTGMAVGHNPSSRTPAWVIERLGISSLNGGVLRTDNFRADPDLAPGRRAELADYVGSGFDRGHMAPAADFTWSNQAMSESFYLSNIAPQDPSLNRGAWSKLEDTVRSWVLQRKELLVITGPIFQARDATIGTNQVQIPYAFFKVIFDPFRREVIAFVYPNIAPATTEIEAFRVPMEQIEVMTGLSLLSAAK